MKTLTHVLIAGILFLCLKPLAAQNAAPGMESKNHNFTSFTETEWYQADEVYELTPEIYQQHPEFGKIVSDAPCEDCFELLDKRTADSRYFVKKGTNGTYFYKQQAYGLLHMKDDRGNFISIDHHLRPVAGAKGLYAASQQYHPVSINTVDQFAAVSDADRQLLFNRQLRLLHQNSQGQVLELHKADWSDFTAGDDGVLVKNIFPGIDLEMKVLRGAVKTDFIIRQPLAVSDGNLLISDKPELPSGMNLAFYGTVASPGEYPGELGVIENGNQVFTLGEPVAYDQSGDKQKAIVLTYKVDAQGHVDIMVPASYLNDPDRIYPVVVDPLVSNSNSLAQGSITGSRYNASCNFTNSCDQFLSVATPPNCTITDIRWSFTYVASGSCWLQDGAVDFLYNGCRSPSTAGYYWFCNSIGGGTCTGTNISIFSDLSSCVPAPQCASYNMAFTMRFYRSCWGSSGCNNSCIGANSPWTMVVEGRTVQSASTANGTPTTYNALCNQNVTLSAAPSFGVPGYTYSWSNGPASQNQVVSHGTNGTFNYSCTVTDACGQTSVTNVQVNVSGCVLGVELEDFTAWYDDPDVALEWKVALEEKMSKYRIERSRDGVSFASAGEVPAKNINGSSYRFSDPNPYSGTSYYRLVMIGLDGEENLSDVVEVSTDSFSPDVRVSGIPADGYFTLIWTGEENQSGELEIMDVSGRIISRKDWSERPGERQELVVSVRGLDAGIYLVRFKGKILKIPVVNE